MRITVNDASKLTGLSPYTIRYYLREGLLPTVSRDRNGTRQFSPSDLELLGLIKYLKECGLSIQDIRSFITLFLDGDNTLPDRLTLLRQKHTDLECQIESLRRHLDNMHYLILYYENALQDGQSSSFEDIPLHTLADLDLLFRTRGRLPQKNPLPAETPS